VVLPVQVTRFLRTHIDSVEKLDLLLVVAKAPERRVPLAVLARLARLPPGVTRRLAGELEAANIVTLVETEVQLLPVRVVDREALEDLLHHHQLDREAVLDALMGRIYPR